MQNPRNTQSSAAQTFQRTPGAAQKGSPPKLGEEILRVANVSRGFNKT